jgi:hypothetical protein
MTEYTMTESTRALLENPDDPRHGTITAYTHHACPCDKCKAANKAATRAARDRRQQNVPEHVHGSENGYSNYRCHCARCKQAHADTQRAKRRRK